MKNKYFVAAGLTAVFVCFAAVLALTGQNSDASTAPYPFLVRGHVQAVSTISKNVTVKAEHGSVAAMNEIRNLETVFSINGSSIYQWVNGVKKPVSNSSIKPGQEVVIRGTRTASGNWEADWLVINEKGFSLVGRVKDVDPSNQRITVLVGRSSYRHSQYVNTELKLRWTDQNTDCWRRGTSIDCTAVPNNNQLIKVVGDQAKDGGHAWVINKLWDSLPE